MSNDAAPSVRAKIDHWRHELMLLGAIAALIIVVGAINPMFLSSANVTSILLPALA